MWIKQLFIYMEKVVMLKKLFITAYAAGKVHADRRSLCMRSG